MSEQTTTGYVPAEKQGEYNYQVLHVVGGVLVTKYSFWAKDDKDAGRLAEGITGTLCRVLER
jgi:hypothetical protein